MKYLEVQEFIKRNSHLIGKVNEKGFVINEIIPVPQDENKRIQYIHSYIQTHNEELSIAPYINEELAVWAIDTMHLKESNILFYEELAK